MSKKGATSFSDRTDTWECQICVAAIRLEMTKKSAINLVVEDINFFDTAIALLIP